MTSSRPRELSPSFPKSLQGVVMYTAQRLRKPKARPNTSLELTRSGSPGLAATGQVCYCPSAAKPRLPTRAAQLQR